MAPQERVHQLAMAVVAAGVVTSKGRLLLWGRRGRGCPDPTTESDALQPVAVDLPAIPNTGGATPQRACVTNVCLLGASVLAVCSNTDALLWWFSEGEEADKQRPQWGASTKSLVAHDANDDAVVEIEPLEYGAR